jgi:hypothetical protein
VTAYSTCMVVKMVMVVKMIVHGIGDEGGNRDD